MLGGMSEEKEDQKYIPWHVILAPAPQISQKTKRKNGKRIHGSQTSSTFFFLYPLFYGMLLRIIFYTFSPL